MFLVLSAAADDQLDIIRVFAHADEVALPVIVLGEYRYGISQSRNSARYENWLAGLITDCIILDINEESTHHYAAINLELRRIGKPIPTNDLWIAALGRQHGMPIVSRDRHFDLVPGLRRLHW